MAHREAHLGGEVRVGHDDRCGEHVELGQPDPRAVDPERPGPEQRRAGGTSVGWGARTRAPASRHGPDEGQQGLGRHGRVEANVVV